MFNTTPSDEALLANKMSREVYNEICEPLLIAGFNADQLEELILRALYKNAIKAVERNYEKLLSAPYALTHQQIIDLAVRPGGGALNIEAFIKFFEDVRSLGFDADQIYFIAINSGSEKLKAIANFKEFSELGLTINDILNILKHSGGAQSLTTLKESFPKLLALPLNLEQIIRIAAHKGGSHEIKCALTHFKTLIIKGYKPDYIVDWLSQIGGYRYLSELIKNDISPAVILPAPRRLAIPAQPRNMSKNNKSLKINSFNDNSNFMVDTSSTLLLNNNKLAPLPLLPFEQLDAGSLVKEKQQLESHHLTPQEPLDSAWLGGAQLSLLLLFLEFTPEQAGILIHQSVNSDTLSQLLNSPYELSHEQVVDIVVHENGVKNIQALRQHFLNMIALGYSKNEIINLLLSDDGDELLSYITNEIRNVIVNDLIPESSSSSSSLATSLVSYGLFSTQTQIAVTLNDKSEDPNEQVIKRARHD